MQRRLRVGGISEESNRQYKCHKNAFMEIMAEEITNVGTDAHTDKEGM